MPCLIKYKLDINVKIVENWQFSVVVSLQKLEVFLDLEKRKYLPHFRRGFQEYSCESGSAIFAGRVTWNYTSSLFKIYKYFTDLPQ